MLDKMLEYQAKRFFGRVWEDTLGYLKLYEYLKLRLHAVSPSTTHKLLSVEEFWNGALGERFSGTRTEFRSLRDGDLVRFQSGFLTEWAPKLPGKLWTRTGSIDLAAGLKHVEGSRNYGGEMYCVLDPDGKRKVLDAGHGSVRIPRASGDSDHFAYMSLVDERHWNCDYGIPLVVSRPVFQEFIKHANLGSPAVGFMEGVVRIGSELPLSQTIPRAIGGELSKASEESLRLSPGLPRVYVHVVSPLSVKLLHNDSHPTITAWTMYSTNSTYIPYGYSYIPVNPLEKDAHERASAFLNSYAKDHGARSLVTDYDGVVPRLQSRIPMSRDPFSISELEVNKLFRGIDRWNKKVIERL